MDGKKIGDLEDAMLVPWWSIGMACVWIVNPTPLAAGPLWKCNLEDVWLDDNLKANVEIQRARALLIHELVTGGVQATGLSGGQRVPIQPPEWEDIKLTYEDRGDDGLVHRAHNTAGVVYTRILVSRPDVQRRWPEQKARTAVVLSSPAKRGPKKGVLKRVKAEMVSRNDMNDLQSMTEEAMAATFSASRDTCRRARSEVLSEFVGKSNSDK
ncbi:hypothetical protein [Nitrobacter winogradskyi]|uniref:Uncharacterized protein n=2 Tax=Nitrobacter winogradskyi TaxID=913 RepID=A0ACC6AGN9_NITWI|nr:hypothetical protein [Nitrobacter winogradskyi]MCP1998135.1 hypothetical protein [Nitrobacter winogradskyi]GEC15271.1 hypothetical protein NWI01_11630 [Nitrobacter winogradskyi]